MQQLDEFRAIGATPAGLRLIDTLREKFEAEKAALLICDKERFLYHQGCASVWKTLIDAFEKVR